MNLQLSTMPTTDPEFRRWIERKIASNDLLQTVRELHTLSGATQPKTVNIDDALTQRLNASLEGRGPQVLSQGLSSLTDQQFRNLIRNPELLLALQRYVLLACAPYWDQLLDAEAQNAPNPSSIESLQPENQPLGLDDSPPLSAVTNSVAVAPARTWFIPAAVSSIGTAAALLIAFYWMQPETRSAPVIMACRWQIDELMRDTDEAKLIQHIEDGITWPQTPHQSSAVLAKEISNYRARCSEMILADFPSMSNGKRKQLRELCRSWATKMDIQLVAAERIEDNDQKALERIHEEMRDLLDGARAKLSELRSRA